MLQFDGVSCVLGGDPHLVFDAGRPVKLLKVVLVLRLSPNILLHWGQGIFTNEIPLLDQAHNRLPINSISYPSRVINSGGCLLKAFWL